MVNMVYNAKNILQCKYKIYIYVMNAWFSFSTNHLIYYYFFTCTCVYILNKLNTPRFYAPSHIKTNASSD